jgi:hypothetical protein
MHIWQEGEWWHWEAGRGGAVARGLHRNERDARRLAEAYEVRLYGKSVTTRLRGASRMSVIATRRHGAV